MADITLSPIPYNGGGLQTQFHNVSYCDLGGGVYLHVILQTNPNYVFAYVSTNTNIKTGTFSSTASTMRVIFANPSSVSAMRVWKLASSRALLLFNGNLYVLEVGAGNDITVKAATIANFWPYKDIANMANGAYGSFIQGWYVRDNVIYFAKRPDPGTSSGSLEILKVAYNPAGDSLSQASIITNPTWAAALTNTNAAYCRFYMQSIPNSTRKLFYARVHANGASAGVYANSIVFGKPVILDTANDQIYTNVPAAPANTYAMCALTDTTILAFDTTKSYYIFNGTSWTTTPTTYSTYNTAQKPFQAEALDSQYFALFTYNGDSQQATTGWIRIGRYVDAQVGQTSTATIGTASADGISFSIPANSAWEQTTIFKDSTDAFLIQGRSGNVTPLIRVIYQPGG